MYSKPTSGNINFAHPLAHNIGFLHTFTDGPNNELIRGLHAAKNGLPFIGQGIAGSGLNLLGATSNTSLDFGSPDHLRNLTKFTIFLLFTFRGNAGVTNGHILRFGGPDGANMFYALITNSTPALHFRFRSTTTTFGIESGTLTAGQLYTAVGSWDGAVMNSWLNGVLTAGSPVAATGTMNNTSTNPNLLVGQDPGAPQAADNPNVVLHLAGIARWAWTPDHVHMFNDDPYAIIRHTPRRSYKIPAAVINDLLRHPGMDGMSLWKHAGMDGGCNA